MDIEQRDYQDMHREISPLKQAEDAVLVDTSDMNIEQVVEAITSIVEEKKAACKQIFIGCRTKKTDMSEVSRVIWYSLKIR